MKKYFIIAAVLSLTSCSSMYMYDKESELYLVGFQKFLDKQPESKEVEEVKILTSIKLEKLQFIKNLNKLYRANNVGAIFIRFQQINDPDILVSGAGWLADIIKSEEDARYHYLYASTLIRMSQIKNIDQTLKEDYKETAALFFYTGRYILIIDAERCQEEVSRMALLMNMELEIEEEILKIMNNFSKEKQEKIGQMALQIEENKKKRKKQGWICKQSREYLSRYRAQDPDCNDCTIQKNGKITNIIFPEKSNLIKYKSDKDWLQKRNEMRNALSGTKN